MNALNSAVAAAEKVITNSGMPLDIHLQAVVRKLVTAGLAEYLRVSVVQMAQDTNDTDEYFLVPDPVFTAPEPIVQEDLSSYVPIFLTYEVLSSGIGMPRRRNVRLVFFYKGDGVWEAEDIDRDVAVFTVNDAETFSEDVEEAIKVAYGAIWNTTVNQVTLLSELNSIRADDVYPNVYLGVPHPRVTVDYSKEVQQEIAEVLKTYTPRPPEVKIASRSNPSTTLTPREINVAVTLGHLMNDHFGVSEIDLATSYEETGLDSLDIVELIMFLEEEYDIEINETDVDDSFAWIDLIRLVVEKTNDGRF